MKKLRVRPGIIHLVNKAILSPLKLAVKEHDKKKKPIREHSHEHVQTASMEHGEKICTMQAGVG